MRRIEEEIYALYRGAAALLQRNSRASPESIYWHGLLVIVPAYIALYGFYLFGTDFLPFTFDSNESFGTLIHARNLFEFGLGRSFGLTDEAYGLDPAAHPFVYTHQGNFPRLPALVAYALGWRSAEAQIAVSTFTTGLLGFVLAYDYFCRRANPTFAVTYCLLLMTDYLMHAQWQVNTFRVWHLFFIFSTLGLVDRLHGTHQRAFVALAVLNMACLFYFELVFAVFVAACSAVYALIIHHRTPRQFLRTVIVLGSGAAIGIGTLVAQDVAYLGWDGFLRDLNMTFIARNKVSADPAAATAFLGEMREFVRENQIVFWDNIVVADSGETLRGLVTKAFSHNFLVYTPVLVLSSLVFLLAWLFSLVVDRSSWPSTRSCDRQTGWRQPAARVALYAAFLSFMISVCYDHSFSGALKLRSEIAASEYEIGLLALFAWLALPVLVLWPNGRSGLRWTFPSWPRALGAVAYLAVIALLVRNYPLLYIASEDSSQGHTYASFWATMIASAGGIQVFQLAIVLAGWLGVRLILTGKHAVLGRSRRGQLTGLLPFLVTGVLAFATVFALSPGYVVTGYLIRHCPLFVYFSIAIMALPLYLLLRSGTRSYRAARRLAGLPSSSRRTEDALISLRGLMAGASIVVPTLLFVFLVFYWCKLQTTYASELPPDQLSVLKMLREPPYLGSSFVSDTYAAPIAARTGSWAYMDLALQNDAVELSEDGFQVLRDDRYLWLADRARNAAYQYPDYYICLRPATLRELAGPGGNVDCSVHLIVANAISNKPRYLQHQIVALDESGRNRWAIVRLDWDYPPFLKSLRDEGIEQHVRASPRRRRDGIGFSVAYRYAHQQGKPEASTIFSLYQVSHPTSAVEGTSTKKLLLQATRADDLVLPPTFSGSIVISVTPRTASKKGPEYFSMPIALK